VLRAVHHTVNGNTARLVDVGHSSSTLSTTRQCHRPGAQQLQQFTVNGSNHGNLGYVLLGELDSSNNYYIKNIAITARYCATTSRLRLRQHRTRGAVDASGD